VNLNGVPLHPLVVHAVVVLTPITGLLAIALLVPRWRWLLRWPLAVAAVGGAVATWLASTTGDDLKHRLNLHSAMLDKHEMWAGRLQAGMWVMAALAVVALLVLPFHSPIGAGTDRPARIGVLTRPLLVVLPLVGIAVLALVYLTGDAGAHLVWDGTPK
jgi:hypothetical protein